MPFASLSIIKRGKMVNKKSKKIVIASVIIGLVLLSMAAGFIFSSGYSENIKRFLSDLNPFRSDKDDGKGGESVDPGPSKINETPSVSSGGAGGTTSTTGTTGEVVYGDGKLSLANWVSDYDFGGNSLSIIHFATGTEGYDAYDREYADILFSPSGKKTKIISSITGYELRVDARPTNSTSTVYLELSLDSQTNSDITVNASNELMISMPLIDSGYNFSGKTITIQQYDPSNSSAVYTAYDIRQLTPDGRTASIILPDLDGTYASEVPYAYFKIMFS